MTDSNPAPSKIIPNSYQSPNFLVDDLMRYLSGNEHKCADVICRKTFGWHKRSDRISKGQLMELAGLGEDAVDECMAELVRYKVVLRLSENKANMGVEWAMQTDDRQIDMPGLMDRDNKRREANRARIAKAQAKRKGGVVQPPHHVEPPVSGVVQPPPQKTVKANVLVVVNAAVAEISKGYEQEFGGLTPMIADAIRDAVDNYPPEWIPEAMQIAVTANKRSWNYVEGILKRCKEKNVRPSLNKLEKSNGNHNSKSNRERTPKPAEGDDFMEQLAKKKQRLEAETVK